MKPGGYDHGHGEGFSADHQTWWNVFTYSPGSKAAIFIAAVALSIGTGIAALG